MLRRTRKKINHLIKYSMIAIVCITLAGTLGNYIAQELQDEKDYCMYTISGQLEVYRPQLNCTQILSAKDMLKAIEYRNNLEKWNDYI